MRYKIDGSIVKSENSAKSTKEASAYVVRLLKEFGATANALDYGCGKLRYAVYLRRLAKTLTLVDSEIQLSRTISILNKKTSIREFVHQRWPGTRVLNQVEFRDDKRRFGFILCANVLSAIPSIRVRSSVLRLLRNRLNQHGRCLIICQHTNSYFWRQMRDTKVRKYADGFLKGSTDNQSFYGLIPPDKLEKLVSRAGFSIHRKWVNDQSCYIVAAV